jgi:hypothetical protein
LDKICRFTSKNCLTTLRPTSQIKTEHAEVASQSTRAKGYAFKICSPQNCRLRLVLLRLNDKIDHNFLKRLPGVGSKLGSSRIHLFSHFSPLYR